MPYHATTRRLGREEMAATMRRGYKQMLKEAVEKLKDRLLAGADWAEWQNDTGSEDRVQRCGNM